jgi:hypothetical protein
MCNSLNFMTRFYEFLLSSKQTHRVSASVGRFSDADPVLYPVLIMGFATRTDRHFEVWEPNWNPTSGSHLIENRLWEPVQMRTCIFGWGGGENRTGSLIELKSGSHSSLCHLLVLLVEPTNLRDDSHEFLKLKFPWHNFPRSIFFSAFEKQLVNYKTILQSNVQFWLDMNFIRPKFIAI